MIVFTIFYNPIGSMYAIYGNIYHQYTPNVSIYTIHGSYRNHFIQVPYLQPMQPMCASPQDGPPIEDRLLQQRCALSRCHESGIFDPEKMWSPQLVLPAGLIHSIYIYIHYTYDTID